MTTLTCCAFALLDNPPAAVLSVAVLAAGYLLFGLDPHEHGEEPECKVSIGRVGWKAEASDE